MEKYIVEYLNGIRFHEVQTSNNLGIIPLTADGNGGPEYISLKKALGSGLLTVGEVSEGGSVPQLKVINSGDIPVLLLDGEELSGAKQNRVLNTTILIAGHTETVIPVSCTEHGRWSYRSKEFTDSDVIMYSRARREKSRDVTTNLRESQGFRSNQGTVWDTIEEMRGAADVHAPTGAMKDVFEQKAESLNEYGESIPCIPGQRGMMVFINGTIVGFDILSRADVYGELHGKLVKSYAMEALIDQKQGSAVPSGDAGQAFLASVAAATAKHYPSAGLGNDYRFEAEGKVGSALVIDKSIIHMAFFAIAESRKDGPMSGLRNRRDYRRR